MKPPLRPALKENEAHVWLANLPSALPELPRLTAFLSADEVERAAKFHSAEHREHWQITRGILRFLLARYAETSANEIVFQYGEHGKPELRTASVPHLHFNTSHSGDYAVFAFTRAGDIGVDMERIREDMPRCDEIARRYFAPGEQQQLFARSRLARVRAFFTIWTRKEAFVKARGTGLFSGLEQFEVSLDEPRVLHFAGSECSDNWWMAALPDVSGYEGAVVVNAAQCAARFWKWHGDL